jgi:hypothetical protein
MPISSDQPSHMPRSSGSIDLDPSDPAHSLTDSVHFSFSTVKVKVIESRKGANLSDFRCFPKSLQFDRIFKKIRRRFKIAVTTSTLGK